MTGNDDKKGTDQDNDPAHPRNPTTRGQNPGMDLGALGGLSNLGGGGLSQMLNGIMKIFMQLFQGLGTQLANHDANAGGPASRFADAHQAMQQRAATDPAAKELLTQYNTANDGLKTAVDGAKKSPTAASFLALESAEMDRSIAGARIVSRDARVNGDPHMDAQAIKLQEDAGLVKSTIAKIKELTPEQQQQVMDKFTQDHPDSNLTRNWKQFEAGDLSRWQNLSSQTPAAGANGQRTSASAQYNVPGEGISGADGLGLKSAFNAVAPLPTATPQPIPTAPVITQNTTVKPQTFNV